MINDNNCSVFDVLTSKLGVVLTPILTAMTFVATYFYNLTLNNYEQYIAIIAVVFLDGIFGIIAGTKREGFKTFKAISVLRTAVTWVIILTVLLSVENAFRGSGWLSETVLIPFIVFQMIA